MFADLIDNLFKRDREKRDPGNLDNVFPENNLALATRQAKLADKMVDLAVSKGTDLPPPDVSEEDLIKWSREFILGLLPEDFAELGFRRADGRDTDKKVSELVYIGTQITDPCLTDIQRKAIAFEIGVFRAFRKAIARRITQIS